MPTRAKTSGRVAAKVAIVTGAGGGIGESMAKALHAEGAHVLVTDVSGRQEDVAMALGEGAAAMRVDVSDDADVEAMIRYATEQFGRLDVLCNNAGIDGDVAPLAECSVENFDRVLAVNLRGVYLGMRHAIPAMVATGGGSIINTASAAGQVGFPGLPAYCASKGGVIALTRAAAADYAKDGIRCNAICPGAVETPLLQALRQSNPDIYAAIETHVLQTTPQGRFGTPAEIASLAVYLASDDSSFLTGAAVPVDGGYTMV